MHGLDEYLEGLCVCIWTGGVYVRLALYTLADANGRKQLHDEFLGF